MSVDRDDYPDLWFALRRFEIEYGGALAAKAREQLKQLIAEREQAARLHAKREARAIVESLLGKVDSAMVDVTALCKELGVERKELDGTT